MADRASKISGGTGTPLPVPPVEHLRDYLDKLKRIMHRHESETSSVLRGAANAAAEYQQIQLMRLVPPVATHQGANILLVHLPGVARPQLSHLRSESPSSASKGSFGLLTGILNH